MAGFLAAIGGWAGPVFALRPPLVFGLVRLGKMIEKLHHLRDFLAYLLG
jgi:hypothetical protein